MKIKEIETSIIIPILNEEKYIEHTVSSVISGTKNIDNMELLLVDGGSTDNTLRILNKLKNKHSFIRILHNSKHEIAPALNLAIKESKGKFIVRMDAHAEFPKNYVNILINALKEMPNEVANVGGTLETKSMSGNIVGETIAIVSSSKLGVGNTLFRTEKTSELRYVDTVPFGTFRKDALLSVGCFNEHVGTSEDLELNNKLRSAGYKIAMLPNVSFVYFCRENLRPFIIQQFDNGSCVMNKNSFSKSFYKLRHYIPMAFTLYLISLIIIALSQLSLLKIIATIPFALYMFIALILGLANAIQKSNPLFILTVPIILLTLHLSYGFGSIYGLLQIPFPFLRSINRK